MKPRAIWQPWLMLAPTLLVLLTFFVLPVLLAARNSLYSWDLLTDPRYVGLTFAQWASIIAFGVALGFAYRLIKRGKVAPLAGALGDKQVGGRIDPGPRITRKQLDEIEQQERADKAAKGSGGGGGNKGKGGKK